MIARYAESAKILFSQVRLRPFSALREVFSEGYKPADFRADIGAGAVVGLVAIPLAMALAIASGVPPQYGLYTAVIAGFVTALFGGSRFQVTGPTAAFVVVLAPVVHRFGISGLLLAGFMAGVILVFMGAARMGQLIQFIPHPVVTGFTSGIALVIATIQLKDFFGLALAHPAEKYFERVAALVHAAPTWSPVETGIGVLTLSLLIFWPKVSKRVPAPLAALTIAALAAFFLEKQGVAVSTIGSRFVDASTGVRGIPHALPAFRWPWLMAGPGGDAAGFDWRTLEALAPSAFAIALLGAIESLLSAVVADGMGQTRHDPDAELVALGTSNLICPFFGGIPATGAIARTAANIRFGARSPIAAMAHAVFILLAVVFFAPVISRLPMAGLAALLLLVAYNMAELRHFKHILRVAPLSDVLVLLLCFGLTVCFDMVIGVSVGIVLAALLFMRRMAQVTSGRVLPETHHARSSVSWPKGVMLYEITGALFFGAVENAIEAVEEVDKRIKVVIFLMEGVHAMDVTGLEAFESAVQDIADHGQMAILVGVRPQPAELMTKSSIIHEGARGIKFCYSLEEAAREANAFLKAN